MRTQMSSSSALDSASTKTKSKCAILSSIAPTWSSPPLWLWGWWLGQKGMNKGTTHFYPPFRYCVSIERRWLWCKTGFISWRSWRWWIRSPSMRVCPTKYRPSGNLSWRRKGSSIDKTLCSVSICSQSWILLSRSTLRIGRGSSTKPTSTLR